MTITKFRKTHEDDTATIPISDIRLTDGKAIVISPSGTVLDGYYAECAARLKEVEKISIYVIPTRRWQRISKLRKLKKIKNPLDNRFTA